MELLPSEWRALAPSDTINASGTGHGAKLIHIDTFNAFLDPQLSQLVNRADVIVVQRNIFWKPAWDAIDYWRGMGKAVVCDLDDHYPGLPISNPAYRFWIQNVYRLDPNPVDGLRIGLSKCDALTSPSRLILDDWSGVVPGYWLPNFARGAWWATLRDREEARREEGLEGRVVVGWGGSVSHYDSWWGTGLREAAAELVRRRPQVVFKLCGNDLRIWEQLPVPDGNKRLQRGVPPEKWPQVVATFDVGVAPLYGYYDQRRSWIKGLEYLLAGVPWVGTAGAPYAELAEHGTLIENGAEHWLDALIGMVDNLVEAQARAREARPMALERWTMERNVGFTINIYEKILARRRSVPALPGVAWVNWADADKERAQR